MPAELLLDYPNAPQIADEHIIAPSEAFKLQIMKVTGAILLFLLSYIVLLVLAAALAVLCAFIGIKIISVYINFLTLMLGGGLVGLGIMVIYFLLKFIFKRNKVDRSGLIEVTAKDQLVLFDFIKKVSKETHTKMPKRVYLSDDVNASVFYDSSFLSLFLPIKKNLRIGLGLVNVLNVSEFKAVIAHEFGHFSQRSMKFGSYVYYVNNIIYSMLYDNDDYTRALQGFANISKYFYIFAVLTSHITRGIQYFLRQVYIVVNKAYSSLSIEMEFHADSVSAYVTGSDHLITSLKKLDVAQVCYTNVLNYCNSYISKNLKATNFYPQQIVVLEQFAKNYNIPFKNGGLELTENTNVFVNESRIVIKDQWASHPSNADRESRLKTLNIKTATNSNTAWVLFNNYEAVQSRMTDKLYDNVKFKTRPDTLDLQTFTAEYHKEIENNNYNLEYKGFYDGRALSKFNVKELINTANPHLTFNDVFSDINCNLPAKINNTKRDIETLKAIAKPENKIKLFDFDGAKYSFYDAYKLQKYLEEELTTTEAELFQADKMAFSYFYHHADTPEKQQELADKYTALFLNEGNLKDDLDLYHNAMEAMQPVYNTVKIAEIGAIIKKVNNKEEQVLPRMRTLLLNERGDYDINDEQKKKLDTYLKYRQVYFSDNRFDNLAISTFNDAMNTFAAIVIDQNFKMKKQLFDFQLHLA